MVTLEACLKGKTRRKRNGTKGNKKERHVLVCLVDIRLIVRKAARHYSAEEEIEWFGPGPFFFEVVHLKGAIRWNTAGLQC